MVRLTKAQRAALSWLAERRGEFRYWTSVYVDPPLNILNGIVTDGLALRHKRDGWFDGYCITPAGRQALEAHHEQ